MDTRSDYAAAAATRDIASLLAAHRRAMGSLSPAERASVLAVIRRELLVGTRTEPSDLDALARFVAHAEMRRAGRILDTLPEALADRLRLTVLLALPVQDAPGPGRPVVAADDNSVPLGATWDFDKHAIYQYALRCSAAHYAFDPGDLWHRRRRP